MPRDYFRRARTGSVISAGTIITDVQSSLNATGIQHISVDGLFGRQTETALSTYQTDSGLAVTGTVSDTTWPPLMRTNEPEIFARCLQVTASFEGTGFTQVVGNFDGAGITWGIIGFTLVGGELGTVLSAINSRFPEIITESFGHDAGTIMRITGNQTSKDQKLAWADSVSRGTQKYNVAEPWRTYFNDLGGHREVQMVQLERAREVYWGIATRDAGDLGLGEELDLLLMYDVAVQNGGMRSKDRLQDAQVRIQAQSPATAADKRAIIAQVVADSITSQYKQDVLTRKMTIARGAGTVHGGNYDLADWGFLDGVKPAALS